MYADFRVDDKIRKKHTVNINLATHLISLVVTRLKSVAFVKCADKRSYLISMKNEIWKYGNWDREVSMKTYALCFYNAQM